MKDTNRVLENTIEEHLRACYLGKPSLTRHRLEPWPRSLGFYAWGPKELWALICVQVLSALSSSCRYRIPPCPRFYEGSHAPDLPVSLDSRNPNRIGHGSTGGSDWATGSNRIICVLPSSNPPTVSSVRVPTALAISRTLLRHQFRADPITDCGSTHLPEVSTRSGMRKRRGKRSMIRK